MAEMPLRELARQLRISAAHQPDIEHSRRMPSDQLLRATAKVLASQAAAWEQLRALDAQLGLPRESRT